MSRFDPTLTDDDIELTRQFMIECHVNSKEYFSSDTFREFQLDQTFTDPSHMIGAYFAKLKWNRVFVAVGEEPSKIDSNNKRKVDLFKFDYARWRCIIKSRLVNFSLQK